MNQEKETIVKAIRGWGARHPVFVFLSTFAISMGLFYVVTIFSSYYRTSLLPSYQQMNAAISGMILSLLGQNITVVGDSISTPGFAITIKEGCDAIEPIALFVFAVFAFPVPFLKKIPGIIIGVLILVALNFVRIVSLFLIGLYFPKAFDIMHIDVWQAIFILIAIIFWIFWLQWVTKKQAQASQV